MTCYPRLDFSELMLLLPRHSLALTIRDIVILEFNVEKRQRRQSHWVRPLGILNAFRPSLHQEHGREPYASYWSTAMGFLGVPNCVSLDMILAQAFAESL